MRQYYLFILLMVLAPHVMAEEGHMKLLAATESRNGTYRGSLADLYLDVSSGQNRVYMDTYPLSKLDTQMSTRFAKEISCSFLDMDCSGYDFFYTIRAGSATIGGPSAGAAISVLTTAMLDRQTLDPEVSITGTINSGGLIGRVGAIKEKVEAASKNGIKKVLIPIGTSVVREDNITTDLIEYGESLGIEVLEVATLRDAMIEFTGKQYPKQTGDIDINPQYTKTMREIARDLCMRTGSLRDTYESGHPYSTPNSSMYLDSVNKSDAADALISEGRHYSAASYCFGANIQLRYLILSERNMTDEQIASLTTQTLKNVRVLEERVDNYTISTITDLQTYIVVKERILEAIDSAQHARRSIESNRTEEAVYSLAYSLERLHSAQFWSYFFGKGNKKLDIEDKTVKESCIMKLREAEERIAYLELILPLSINDTRRELTKAYDDHGQGYNELCLFRASKAKAEADAYLGMMGMQDEDLHIILDEKLNLTREVIVEQQIKGSFPILGYSYFEYAQSLQESKPYSSFIYSEYALELSNLDLYFMPKEPWRASFALPGVSMSAVLLIGMIIGILMSSIFFGYKEITFKRKLEHYYRRKYKK